MDKYRDKGFEILGESNSYEHEMRLLSLKREHEKNNLMLTISCISNGKYHQYKTSREFAQFNKDVLDTGFSKAGLLSSFTLDRKKFGNKEFSCLKVNLSRIGLTRKAYTMELFYLLHKKSVLTVTIGYKNEVGRIVLYSLLETLNFQPEV